MKLSVPQSNDDVYSLAPQRFRWEYELLAQESEFTMTLTETQVMVLRTYLAIRPTGDWDRQ
jgi:hypothetical protein